MTDTVSLERIERAPRAAAPDRDAPISPVTRSDSVDLARQARIAQLRQQRAAGPCAPAPGVAEARARSPRDGMARGSKIAAAGLGCVGMLSMVAAMALAGRSSAAVLPPSARLADAPSQVVVVMHPADDITPPVDASATVGPAATSADRPIVLSAQPTVRQAPASPAPTAQTHGSR